jgi:hypothetical protein
MQLELIPETRSTIGNKAGKAGQTTKEAEGFMNKATDLREEKSWK